jgi:spermidine synthase
VAAVREGDAPMRPWKTLDRVATPAGVLELRQRGSRDFLIVIDGRVLMTSAAPCSEQALARAACGRIARRAEPCLLIGGLGMAYTLRAALDLLPRRARVVVAEVEPAVVRWCEGPLAELTDCASADPRVAIELADVAELIAAAARGGRQRFDAIALDLCGGPRGSRAEAHHPLYGNAMLEAVRRALAPRGVFAVWSEEAAPGFEKRLVRCGFEVQVERAGRGGRRHVIYTGGLSAR